MKTKYDPFTKNPLKLLAQKLLPETTLIHLWKTPYHTIMVPDKHYRIIVHPLVGIMLGTELNNDLKLWLNNKAVMIQHELQSVNITFKHETEAVLFKLIWN